jgi:hypothetical protein
MNGKIAARRRRDPNYRASSGDEANDAPAPIGSVSTDPRARIDGKPLLGGDSQSEAIARGTRRQTTRERAGQLRGSQGMVNEAGYS